MDMTRVLAFLTAFSIIFLIVGLPLWDIIYAVRKLEREEREAAKLRALAEQQRRNETIAFLEQLEAERQLRLMDQIYRKQKYKTPSTPWQKEGF